MRVPTIPGTTVVLRPWHVDEAAWYVTARHDEVLHWTAERSELTVEEGRAGIEGAEGRAGVLPFAIADQATGELLGKLGLFLATLASVFRRRQPPFSSEWPSSGYSNELAQPALRGAAPLHGQSRHL